MAISLASLHRTTALQPPRILMHGVAGVGKSTFAAKADAPVFIMTEDGLGKLQVPHFPLATSYTDVSEALEARQRQCRVVEFTPQNPEVDWPSFKAFPWVNCLRPPSLRSDFTRGSLAVPSEALHGP